MELAFGGPKALEPEWGGDPLSTGCGDIHRAAAFLLSRCTLSALQNKTPARVHMSVPYTLTIEVIRSIVGDLGAVAMPIKGP